MAVGSLLPSGYETLEDANGVTVPGGLVWTYASGTTTPQATFSDAALTVPNTNPIIADGAGRWVAYAAAGTGFKLVFETPAIPPAHGATIKTCDPVTAPVTDTTSGATGGVTNVSDNTTGTINNFILPGRTKDTLWSWNGSADLTLTGIAGGASGDRLTIKNMSAVANRKILLPHMSASSTNPFYNIATSAPTPVGPSGWVTYIWVGGTWVLTDHEQGDPLTAIFAAANFTGSGGMVWTVAGGNVSTLTYVLRGRQLTVSFYILNTTVAAPLSTGLQIGNGAWGGFTTVSAGWMTSYTFNDAGTGNTTGFTQGASTTQIGLYKVTLANWTASAALTAVYGEVIFQVT